MRVNHRMVMVGEKEIRRKIFSLLQVLEQISSDNKKKKKRKKKLSTKSIDKEREEFTESLDKLFDNCSCRCPILPCSEASCPGNCPAKVHSQCSCSLDKKIPVMDLEFMFDQRTKKGLHGKFMISGLDVVETVRQQKALEREELERKRQMERKKRDELLEEELYARHQEEV